uniref:Uncharacterized protein n=1 Tax=Pseudomonas aeruginosa TaxID=287 RepID=A0A1V0M6C8_PSEAI|nr:Hypothetical protein [Pseudomonas aeruginosa]QOJ62837.1 Hypothetical protein [Pseudomonas aeruginosa]QOJ63390.1 Hypothetical protein [Pseudomonas aeruginosa]QOJ63944.1 Hypothetical protein [Pseudomonas aeruginosa]QOJ64457.1 Hypothetical protein [Pseudomonas aeruginosa]
MSFTMSSRRRPAIPLSAGRRSTGFSLPRWLKIIPMSWPAGTETRSESTARARLRSGDAPLPRTESGQA